MRKKRRKEREKKEKTRKEKKKKKEKTLLLHSIHYKIISGSFLKKIFIILYVHVKAKLHYKIL